MNSSKWSENAKKKISLKQKKIKFWWKNKFKLNDKRALSFHPKS